MKIYAFDNSSSKQITRFRYGSVGATLTTIAQHAGQFSLNLIMLDANGCLGEHPASVTQAFFIIRGAGTVSGDSQQSQPIHAGQVAVWQAGERHQTTTADGLTAFVLESPSLMLDDRLTLIYSD